MVVCPLCGNLNDQAFFSCDHDVEDNCLLFCGDGPKACLAQMLLCTQTCELSLPDEAYCSKEIDVLEAHRLYPKLLDYFAAIKDQIKSCYPESHCHRYSQEMAGVIEVTHLINTDDLTEADVCPENLHEWTRADRNEFLSKHYHELPKPLADTTFDHAEHNTRHDGVNLFYRGRCTECSHQYESRVSGSE